MQYFLPDTAPFALNTYDIFVCFILVCYEGQVVVRLPYLEKEEEEEREKKAPTEWIPQRRKWIWNSRAQVTLRHVSR